MKTITTILIFLIVISNSYGQTTMEKGFLYLEEGNFAAAETLFENYLNTAPSNKTALICYGRAVGLNGKPQQATDHFGKLLVTYPNDFEVTINYAESYLWGNLFSEALPLYKTLVAQYPKSLAALLGYANTLSNLNQYPEALAWVNRALALDPKNTSAQVSKKYIRLGLANQFATTQQYDKGETTLTSILTDFPEDKDVLLNLGNLYLQANQGNKAIATYRRYASVTKDSIQALNGIALAQHLNGASALALQTTVHNLDNLRPTTAVAIRNRTYERYIQALFWNKKFTTARQLIDSLTTAHPKQNWLFSLRATLALYTGTPEQSIADYNTILATDGISFDGNLGKANALLAADRIPEAHQAMLKTLEFFPNQKDALLLEEKLKRMHTPSLNTTARVTSDNGNNVGHMSSTTLHTPLSSKIETTFSYQYHETENTVSGAAATNHSVQAGLQYKPFPKTKLKTVFGLTNSRFSDRVYTQPLFDATLTLSSLKLQNIDISYQRAVQNFNADLIALEIVQNHFGLSYNLGTNFGLGWYSKLMHSEQSDANTRDLAFSSVYYNLPIKTKLKFGFNYQFISFTTQVPDLYFSPDRYQSVELFGDYTGKLFQKVDVKLGAAFGQQQLEDSPFMPLFRAETELKYQYSKRLSANLFGKYSTASSATAAGFRFMEFGLGMRWLIAEKPLFKF